MSRSARWPPERAAAQNVEMEVIDRLSGVGSGVDHHPKAVLLHASRCRYPARRQQKPPEQRLVLRPCRRQVIEMLPRDNQDVGGRLRIQVVEGDQVRLIQQLVRRDLSLGDFAKDAVGHKLLPPSRPQSRRW